MMGPTESPCVAFREHIMWRMINEGLVSDLKNYKRRSQKETCTDAVSELKARLLT